MLMERDKLELDTFLKEKLIIREKQDALMKGSMNYMLIIIIRIIIRQQDYDSKIATQLDELA